MQIDGDYTGAIKADQAVWHPIARCKRGNEGIHWRLINPWLKGPQQTDRTKDALSLGSVRLKDVARNMTAVCVSRGGRGVGVSGSVREETQGMSARW